MSQLEQNFREFLTKRPEIEKCYSEGLINRQALARYIIDNKLADTSQADATIAMLRRFQFRKPLAQADVFREMKTSIKDGLVIVNYQKSEELLHVLGKLFSQTNYTVSETLKIIVGTENVTIITDKAREPKLDFKVLHRLSEISEISLQFPKRAIDTKGVLSALTTELYMHDITISEFITASSELLLYVKEPLVIKAYEVIKMLKAN
ncbi:MAG: hypothetical protein HGA85_01880 [Nanoarchaeota archaeon]|nr:hypothetical protein [Nanoarchaeota archaeon]